jgi:hypothetical protein
MRPQRRGQAGFLAACAIAVLLPASASGQLRPQPGTRPGWPPVEIGIRVGYDNLQHEELVGALLRVPVLPNGSVELMPNADVTFLRGLKEYQLNLEAVYLLTAGEGGFYLGGGMGFRSTILPEDLTAGRQTITTWSLVLGLKLAAFERVNPMIEFRRIFASELVVDPQPISLGVSLELW